MLSSVDFAVVREALRREREALVGSRAKLEERCGVAESTIYRIETEPTYVPRVPVLLKLVEGLGLTLSDFFLRIEALRPTGEGDPQSPTDRRTPVDVAPVSTTTEDPLMREAALFTAIAKNLSDNFAAAIDRLIDARRPASTSRAPRSVRARRDRKVRRAAS